MNEIAIVTGGSSGIGRETALALKGRGCRVYEFSRHDASVPGVEHLNCDVSDEQQFRAAVQTVIEREGRVDILVNNAGFGISGAAEFTDNAQAKKLLDVNLFGMVNGCRAVIDQMRKQGRGRIVNLSSVAAPCAIPFQVWYSVSKAAVSTYTAALANELRPFGITLTAVMPGDIRTGFTAARKKSTEGDDIYGGRISASVAKMEKDEQNGMRPEDAARTIVRVALKKGRVKPYYAIGLSYKFLVLLDSLLPCRAVRWLLYQLYGK